MSVLLELVDLDVRYGAIRALHGVSLQVSTGQIVTLLGANGAGKTTTLRTISGLLRPTTGQVLFEGEPITGLPVHRIAARGLAHVPEGRRVFPRMSVRENLEMGAYLRRRDRAGDLERVYTLFPVLRERRSQAAGTLSGGEQQMLAIGRALMARPRLLLLDEPSMGLAPLIVAQIFRIIREINDDGTTILLVEQNAAGALRVATRGYVLESGQVAMADNAAALLGDERIRNAYLGEQVGG